MKRRIMRSLALVLALLLLCGGALAEVRATGDVWMRTGPGRNYAQIKSYPAGHVFQYLGETQMDERPVAWYKVSSGSRVGWVSSKFTVLENESSQPAATRKPKPTATPKPRPAPTAAPSGEDRVDLPALGAGGLFVESLQQDDPAGGASPTSTPRVDLPRPAVELSAYYRSDLVSAANEIGLISYRRVESEVPYQYYDDAMILAGNQNVENIVIYGEGYEVYGVHVGMSANVAMACMNAAGLDYSGTANGIITYEHRAADSAFVVDADGHDSCINLWVSAENVVTEIDWSTYTG